MRVLLDTHALFWAVRDPDRLGGIARDLLSDSATGVAVSAISPWEMSTKLRRGRWPEASALVLGYDEILARLGASELAFGAHHAIAAGSLEWEHRDPFDRGLAAQSILEQLPLVTGDPVFKTLPGLRILW